MRSFSLVLMDVSLQIEQLDFFLNVKNLIKYNKKPLTYMFVSLLDILSCYEFDICRKEKYLQYVVVLILTFVFLFSLKRVFFFLLNSLCLSVFTLENTHIYAMKIYLISFKRACWRKRIHAKFCMHNIEK